MPVKKILKEGGLTGSAATWVSSGVLRRLEQVTPAFTVHLSELVAPPSEKFSVGQAERPDDSVSYGGPGGFAYMLEEHDASWDSR